MPGRSDSFTGKAIERRKTLNLKAQGCGAVGVKKVVMRASAGTGGGGVEAKEANAPAAESASPGPAASSPKGNAEKSPETKE